MRLILRSGKRKPVIFKILHIRAQAHGACRSIVRAGNPVKLPIFMTRVRTRKAHHKGSYQK